MKDIYHAAAYARTSKDEADSSSIENQLALIHSYAAAATDITIVSVREDAGYTGINFDRPQFRAMMQDIEDGKINCVIVKDLSRLGRNYIEVGELMEEIFPRYNVRLIACNDNYDSLTPRSESDDILIPFRNLMNEQNARDTSVKVRAVLSSKRKAGQFVNAFAPYGYKRSAENRHQLEVDEHPAAVVRAIFCQKIAGMSPQKIADALNTKGEPSPAEYKKRHTRYRATFQTKPQAAWSAVAVGRVLRNPVYTGVLVQGKQTTPNYKVKQRVARNPEEWDVTHGAHAPIVSQHDFDIVADLLRQDTRAAPGRGTVYPLSGMVFCGDCGNNMVRTKSGPTHYYICASSRTKEKTCMSHGIPEEKLSRSVWEHIDGLPLTRAWAVRFIARVQVFAGGRVFVRYRDIYGGATIGQNQQKTPRSGAGSGQVPQAPQL